jgi:hypothetical protein
VVYAQGCPRKPTLKILSAFSDIVQQPCGSCQFASMEHVCKFTGKPPDRM